jgi:tripartite-type tricarboxylate transporter receptor subunit TctC
MKKTSTIGALLAVSVGVSLPSGAQTYPAKPVHVIVPHQVGAASDLVARGMGQFLSQKMGQPFVIENRVAANGIVGLENLARSAPDGYTISVTNMGAISINPAIYTKLTFDPLKDFAPVANIGAQDIVLMVHPSVPANTMQELIALAKAKPGSLTWASLGYGSHQHITVEWFRTRGIDFHHVPYKSGPQATTAIVSGEVQILQIGTGQSVPMVRSGKLKGIAVTNSARSSFIPDLPSFKEAGLEWAVTTWNGVFAPAATPREIVRRLNADINGLLADPGFKAKVLAGSMIEPAGGTPEEFAAFLRADRQRFAEVAKLAAIKMD